MTFAHSVALCLAPLTIVPCLALSPSPSLLLPRSLKEKGTRREGGKEGGREGEPPEEGKTEREGVRGKEGEGGRVKLNEYIVLGCGNQK